MSCTLGFGQFQTWALHFGDPGSMAYRVELSDGKSTNIWAPIDEDSYIRSVVSKKQKV